MAEAQPGEIPLPVAGGTGAAELATDHPPGGTVAPVPTGRTLVTRSPALVFERAQRVRTPRPGQGHDLAACLLRDRRRLVVVERWPPRVRPKLHTTVRPFTGQKDNGL